MNPKPGIAGAQRGYCASSGKSVPALRLDFAELPQVCVPQ